MKRFNNHRDESEVVDNAEAPLEQMEEVAQADYSAEFDGIALDEEDIWSF